MANVPPFVGGFLLPTLQPLQWYQLTSLNFTYSDFEGTPAVRYEFYDAGVAANSAYFYTPSNAHQPAETSISVTAAELNAGSVWIRGGSSAAGTTEQFFMRAFDGTDWSNWTQQTLTTLANVPPTVTGFPVAINVNGWRQLSNYVSYFDSVYNPAVSYEIWDNGVAANSAYIYTPGNAHNAAETSVIVSNLSDVWIRGGSAVGSETMSVRAFDGISWGDWTTFSVQTSPNHAPSVLPTSPLRLYNNEWRQVTQSLINGVDSDPNDVITQYQFQDLGTGATSGYFYSPANEHWAANTPFTVNAADLGSVYVRGGTAAGSETLQVRAFDGTDWGAWTSFTLTTQLNTRPVLTHFTPIMAINATTLESSLLGYSDAENQAATQYEVYDGRSDPNSAYFYSASNAHYAANTSIAVSAAEFATLGIHAGNFSGTDNMFVRAFDGFDWSDWRSFSVVSVNQPPTATIADHTLYNNQWQQLSSWLSYSDPTNTPAVRYEFWDMGTGATSGYLYDNTSEHHAAGAGNSFIVEAANLSSVWIRGGSAAGTETMRVRAFDGENWSAWDDFNLTTVMNTPPTMSQLSNLILLHDTRYFPNFSLSYSDAESQPATQYELWDAGVAANSGYFSSSGNAHWGADQSILIAASDIASVQFHMGAAGTSDTLFYRASDGLDWSAWHNFTLTASA